MAVRGQRPGRLAVFGRYGAGVLYDYELHLARRKRPGSLCAALEAAEILLPYADGPGEAILPIGGRCFASEFDWRSSDGEALQIMSLLLDEERFPVSREVGLAGLVDWVFQVVEAAELLTLFMPGGSDADKWRPPVPEGEPRHTVGRLLSSGCPDVAHPVLYLSGSLDTVRPCGKIEYYQCVDRGELGQLYLFAAENDDGSVDILEPGPLHDHLLRQLTGGQRRR